MVSKGGKGAMRSGGVTHIVQQGDTVSGLAYNNGLFWETVWNHPNNEKLRELRKYHNILYPGDRVFIPAIQVKEESITTGKTFRFRRKGIPEKFNIQLLDLYGEPFANQPYVLTIDNTRKDGTLDGEGWLRAAIPPTARSGRIEIGESGEIWTINLDFGHLDPVTELSGMQARLKNLGYYKGPVDGSENEEFQMAVNQFRVRHGLDPNENTDSAFLDKLKEVFGT